MSLGCVTRSDIDPPKEIIDTSTLTLSLDNQGVAILQISILTINKDPIVNSCFEFPLNNVVFRGFIESDNPKVIDGSNYVEHYITAKGAVCED